MGWCVYLTANDNKSFDVTTVRSVGCALPDEIMLEVKVKVHENSLSSLFSFSFSRH